MSFDFAAAVQAPFRMQPGLRRLPRGAAHLEPLGPGSRTQREKLAVLSAFADQALCKAEHFDATQAVHALAGLAAAEHPAHWTWDGWSARALTLGAAVDSAGTIQQFEGGRFGLGDEVARCLAGLPPPWRLPGLFSLAFAEDVALIDANTGRVPWMAVALPSHWAPEHKVGKTLADVHAPVPDATLLQQATPALLALAGGTQAWERFVWNVTGHPRLHAHPDRVDPARWDAGAAESFPSAAWWRTERQTLYPLTQARQALFTIRIDVQPLSAAVRSATQANALRRAIASMSPEVLAYRRLSRIQPTLLRWLERLESTA